MPVITRRDVESVHICENETITVSMSDKGRVKLSIDAPDEILALRSELVEENSCVEP